MKKKTGKTIYISEEMFLKEFTNMGSDERNSMATPSADNGGDMANSINQAKQMNPQSDNIMVDTSMFDSTSNNDPVPIDISAKNGQDARTQINNMMTSNPQLKSLQANGNLMAKVHMEGRIISKKEIDEEIKKLRLKKLRENSIEYKKFELNESILKDLI